MLVNLFLFLSSSVPIAEEIADHYKITALHLLNWQSGKEIINVTIFSNMYTYIYTIFSNMYVYYI